MSKTANTSVLEGGKDKTKDVDEIIKSVKKQKEDIEKLKEENKDNETNLRIAELEETIRTMQGIINDKDVEMENMRKLNQNLILKYGSQVDEKQPSKSVEDEESAKRQAEIDEAKEAYKKIQEEKGIGVEKK